MFCKGSYAQLKPAVEAIGASVAVLEIRGRDLYFLVANRRYEKMLGLTAEELIGHSSRSIFPPYIAEEYQQHLDQCCEKGEAVEFEVVLDQRATQQWWRVVISPIVDEHDQVVRILNTCIDISDRMRLEKQLDVSRQRFEAVIQSAYDGVITIDEKQRIRLINRTAQRMFQVSAEEVLGEPLNILIPARCHQRHEEYVEAFSESPVRTRPMHTRDPVVGLRKDGSEFPCEISLAKIHVGSRAEMTAIVRDVSEQTRLIEELRVLASTDSLTGLFNRRKMMEYIEEEIERVARFKRTMALVIFDIDHFKRINDTYGHPVGDRVIIEVGKVVQSQLRRTDRLGRIGGEEFLVLLPETTEAQALEQAERLRATLESLRVTLTTGEEIDVTASFGVIDLTDSKGAAKALIRDADIALYEAKKQGRNRVVCFSGQDQFRAAL